MTGHALPPVIFLMGPTATGKTDLAVALMDHLPVEIVSVDSALIYRGMDIGTAKPDAATLARAPHHLIDIRDPAERYSAAEFAADARHLLRAITAAGRIPLLVGGTMLYFKVLLEGLGNLPPSDPAVRADIDREAGERGWPALHAELMAVDPESARALHPNHSQRIQRALEIYRLTGRPASELKRDEAVSVAPIVDDYRITQIALVPHQRRLLHDRIAVRFRRMLDAGLIDEVQRLMARGDLSPALPSIRAVGYRQVWDYLAGATDYDTMVAKGIAATRQLAKRQLTWLRGWPGAQTLYIDDEQGNSMPLDDILSSCLNNLEAGPIY